MFEVFFDEEVIGMMVEYTILYPRSKGNQSFSVTADEIRAFLGVMLVSGYSPAPWHYLYWSHDPDVKNNAISTAMTRDRFVEIMKYLHLSDNAKLDARSDSSSVC